MAYPPRSIKRTGPTQIFVLPADGWMIRVKWPENEGGGESEHAVFAWEVEVGPGSGGTFSEYMPVLIEGDSGNPPRRLDFLSKDAYDNNTFSVFRADA